MPAPGDGGTRTVTKRGIRVDHFFYTDPALQALVRQRVQVRLDEEDWGRVLILSESGEFVCWALCPERAGVSRAEAAAWLRADGRRIESEFRDQIRRVKREAKISTVAADILGTATEEASSVIAFPSQTPAQPHQTPALEAGQDAVEAKDKPRLVERDDTAPSEADIEALEARRAIAAPKETPITRFVRWESIDRRVGGGEIVDVDEARIWRVYQNSAEFAVIRDQIEREGRASVLGDEQEENQSNA